MSEDSTFAQSVTAQAHEAVGAFILRCALMDYRASQFIARWLTRGEPFKFLSNVMHVMDFEERRQILAERIAPLHQASEALVELASEYAAIMRRRAVVTHAILGAGPDGRMHVKTFSALRILDEGPIDTLCIDDLPEWSRRAVTATGAFVKLSDPLNHRPQAAAR